MDFVIAEAERPPNRGMSSRALSIIFCLTTSKRVNTIPIEYRKYGCRKIKYNQFYFIPISVSLGSEGFNFEVDTIIFFQRNIRKKNITGLDQYIGHNKCEFKTQLTNEEFKSILGCILSSNHCPIGCEGILNNRFIN